MTMKTKFYLAAGMVTVHIPAVSWQLPLIKKMEKVDNYVLFGTITVAIGLGESFNVFITHHFCS